MNYLTNFSDSEPFQKRLNRSSLIALGSLASVALLGCNRSDAKFDLSAPRVVRVIQVDQTLPASERRSQFTGVVHARTESNLGFRVAGKVLERLINTGDAVKIGQPLLKLDPTDYQLALQAARANQKQAELELSRVRVLVEKRAESRDALEKAVAAAETIKAQAEQAADQVSYTTLFADADGVVMSTLAEPGQVVSAGQPVLVLAKNGLREAAIDIPESSLGDIRGGSATARLVTNSELVVPAILRELSGVADPESRTYQARYVLQGDSAQFPLGATVTVSISRKGDGRQQTTEIPLGSLIDRGDGSAVWIVDPQTSKIERRPVSIAELGAETAAISRGLQEGDTLVCLGAQLLHPGDTVRIEKTSERTAR